MIGTVTVRFAIPFLILTAQVLPAADDNSFLLRGATIHTMAGSDIQNGSILVRNGKIAGVGQNLAAPEGVKIIEAAGMQVYPGMIDSASTIGLTEIGAVRETSDVMEIGKFNPQLRASIAVNPDSEHIPVTRANGVTSVIALPDGMGISGQASLISLNGWTTEEMEVKRSAAMHLHMPTIGGSPGRGFGGGFGGGGRTSYDEAKKTFDKDMVELNGFFEEAHRYAQAKAAKLPGFQTNLKLEAMLPVIDGTTPLLITAVRERAIRDAIAFADKQKIKVILCQAIDADKVASELKSRNIPVILGPTLSLPSEEDDPYDRPFNTPANLYKAGVKFSFGSFSNEFSRNLPYQAAAAVGFGLPKDEAMKAITINAAQIWGVANQLGTIEEGKSADFMVTTGDPLEEPTQVRQLFIRGKVVDLENKHHQLYERYKARP